MKDVTKTLTHARAHTRNQINSVLWTWTWSVMKLFNLILFTFFFCPESADQEKSLFCLAIPQQFYLFISELKITPYFLLQKVRTSVHHKERWKDFNVMTSKVCEMLRAREKINNKNVLFNLVNWLSFIVKK